MHAAPSATPTRLDCEVLIVGLGPTGSVLAGLLGAHGVNTLIVDREPDLLNLPRAVHFDGEVMRIFQSMGLADSLLSCLRPSAGMQYVNADGLLMLERKPAEGAGAHGWANNYLFHQPELENALRTHIKRFPSVRIMNSAEVVAICSDSEGVEARLSLSDPAEPECFVRAKWLVGCDGARSLVREQIGGHLIDLGLHQEWLVVDVELLDAVDLPSATVQYCNPKRPITYVNVTGNRRRWEIMIMPGDNPEAMREPSRLWPLLAKWVQPHQVRLVRSALYTFHSLIAQRWRSGRLLIAGDSAHQTPPFLGQGMCAGIRDAANLAWKLAAVVQGRASESILDTYASERLPHVRAFIDTAIRLGNIIQTTDATVAAERDRGFKEAGPQEIVNLSPSLGPGCHDGPAPCGMAISQPKLENGRLLDDALAAHKFAWLTALSTVDSRTQSLINRLENFGVAAFFDQSLASWLAQLGATHALLRPDRYLAALANDLDEVSAWPLQAWGLNPSHQASGESDEPPTAQPHNR